MTGTSAAARELAGETAEFVYATPEDASSWRALNVERNRNVKKSRINGYVCDIRTDNWILTGEAIKLDVNGRLIDGQNRRHAIVAAGEGARALLVRGASRDSLVVLDSVSARRTWDFLVATGPADRSDAKPLVRSRGFGPIDSPRM